MNASILVVDDDSFNVALLSDVCRSAGYTVSSARDGMEALERVRQDRPDAILLDLMMPRLDGFGVCARLRADPELGSIPVLVITASDDLSSRLRALDLGADNYLVKPFRPLDVLGRIRTAIDFRRVRDQLATEANDAENDGRIGSIGGFADLKRDLSCEIMRAIRTKQPLACVAVVPRAGKLPAVEDKRSFVIERAVAISSNVRGSDRVYLLGAKEIVVLLADCDEVGALSAVERIRKVLAEVGGAFGIGAALHSDKEMTTLLWRARAVAMGGVHSSE